MRFKIGIDVGGTFTDFLLSLEDGASRIYKVLSTPQEPSIAVIRGLETMASELDMRIEEFLQQVSVIVHGTTVTTNAVLTRSGSKTALLTTKGLRDTLEMRRGIREEQYNNRYKNVEPLIERYLRLPVEERIDHKGDQMTTINLDDVEDGVNFMIQEGVDAVAICFMNSFVNSRHEETAAEIVSKMLPDVYLTASNRLLPSIRFYDRVSTTVLNSYVGPILKSYISSLVSKLQHAHFSGILLIMQSNGGVISPELAVERAAVTLLSGPAAGPVAGVAYAAAQGYSDCITVDMGGTSFDASLVRDRAPTVTTSGEIAHLKLALPMLNVVTIGAGGGSIGWIDEGDFLKIGPQSAGSNPGPACYDLGGELPTCTDADLVLGYLEKDYFAGGHIPLNPEKASRAIINHIAEPLGIDLYEAAAGMYNVVNVNMAAAVREVSVKQGYDPRDFPLIVVGGAGPNHACMIAQELEISLVLIPRESSIFCAAGMLLSDLKHDFVKTYATLLNEADAKSFKDFFSQMKREGSNLVASEGIPENCIEYTCSLDLRYVKQYHEVNMKISTDEVEKADFDALATRFHHLHNKRFGYSLEAEKAPVELINLRLVCIGRTEKPEIKPKAYGGVNPSSALKGRRKVYLPMQKRFQEVDVFDAEVLTFGNKVFGPAILEQVNTTTFVTPEYNLLVDSYGSYTVYLKTKEKEIENSVLNSSMIREENKIAAV